MKDTVTNSWEEKEY